MRKINFSILLFVFIAIQSDIFANSISTNKQIIDSIFNEFYSKVGVKLSEKKIRDVRINENTNFNYFTNKLVNELSNKNIAVNDKSQLSLKLDVREFEIIYIEVGDEYTRSIKVDASVNLVDKNGEFKAIDSIFASFEDKINSDDINLIENEMFPFTKGKVPKPKKSLFDELLEPVIVVGAAVLTVVLFFSVRTK